MTSENKDWNSMIKVQRKFDESKNLLKMNNSTFQTKAILRKIARAWSFKTRLQNALIDTARSTLYSHRKRSNDSLESIKKSSQTRAKAKAWVLKNWLFKRNQSLSIKIRTSEPWNVPWFSEWKVKVKRRKAKSQ